MKLQVEKRLYDDIRRRINETNIKLQQIIRYHKGTLTVNDKLKKEYAGFLVWAKENENMLQKICDSINEMEWYKNNHLSMDRDLRILKKANPELFKSVPTPPPFPKPGAIKIVSPTPDVFIKDTQEIGG